jgi:hypothetical protein
MPHQRERTTEMEQKTGAASMNPSAEARPPQPLINTISNHGTKGC